MKRLAPLFLAVFWFFSACGEIPSGPQDPRPAPEQALDDFWGDLNPPLLGSQGGPPPPVNCASFPTNFNVAAENASFGVCVSEPVQTVPPQEFPDGSPPITVSGVVHGGPLGDLQVRAQNVSDGVTVVYRTFAQITYNELTGAFSTTLTLPLPGLYNITVTATKYPELYQATKTVSIFRITYPLISFVEPTNGAIVQSAEGVPLQVQVNNAAFVGNNLTRTVYVNGVEQPDVFTGVTGNIHNGIVVLLGGMNQLRVVFSNAAGTADATITVVNDIKGPRIQPIKLCEPFIQSTLGSSSAVSFDLKITDDQGDSPSLVTAINGDSNNPLHCILTNAAQHLYRCSGLMTKAGLNFFSIIAKDSRGNESEVATSCVLAHGIAAPYQNDGALNPRIAMTNGLSFAVTEELLNARVLPALKNYLNSPPFKQDFANLLKTDMPVRGIFPLSKGNSSIEIDPNQTEIGPFDLGISMDPNSNVFSVSIDIGKWKGPGALKTFNVRLFPNSSWPLLDENCGHPIPLDSLGNELPYPTDPTQRLPDGDCAINFSPDFAPNYCNHPLTSQDPTEENRQCFIARIGTSVTHVRFNIDRLILRIPVEIINNTAENKLAIRISHDRVEDAMTLMPDSNFISAHPAFTDPDLRIADINSLFKQTIVKMITGTLPFRANSYLSREQVLWHDEQIEASVDFTRSRIRLVSLGSEGNRAVVQLTSKLGGTPTYLEEFLADAQRRANDQGASLPIDPNGDILILSNLGSPIMNHPIEVQPGDFASSPQRQLGLILKENLINQALFSAGLAGLLSLDYSEKFIAEQEIEVPQAFEPKVRALLGPGIRRSDGTLIPEETPVILKLRSNLSLAPMIRMVSPSELPENADLRAIHPEIQDILELGFGELKLAVYESNDEGEYVSQPDGDCSNTFSPLCKPIVRMSAHGIIYAGIKIMPTSETLRGQHGLADPIQEPQSVVLFLDKTASKIRVATALSSNTDAGHSDRQLSRTFEQILQAALTEKTFNNATHEFEGGLSPVEIGIPAQIVNGDTVILAGDGATSDLLLRDLGINSVGLSLPLVQITPDKGELKLFTNLILQLINL